MPVEHHDSGLALVQRLREWARELGFSQIGITAAELPGAEAGLRAWLAAGYHGEMHYMARHGMLRAHPADLLPGALRVISARLDYLPRDRDAAWAVQEQAALGDARHATVSVYARGRDYHKVLRTRLARLAQRLAAETGTLRWRVFTDSAPLLEVDLAGRAGIGWRGKHTLALARDGGSMFFLGEILIDLPLPVDAPAAPHCGRCAACLAACPTGAIVAPYRLDARRCISYLTIEHPGAIPPALRPLLGNRIYGCDDCQLVCPWNKFARRSPLPDFDERHGLGTATLAGLWQWSEADFLRRTEGSALRRIGWMRWRRNLAVALGNAWRTSGDAALARALQDAHAASDALVREHIDWALAQRGG